MTNTKGTTMPQIDDAELFGNAEDQRAYEDFCANQEAVEKFTLDKPALVCRWRMSNKKVPMLNRHIRALSERLVQGEPLTHNMLSWAKQHVEWSLAEGELEYEVLRRVGKAACDEVAEGRRQTDDYRDYIESWVHEAKLPLAAAHLILENLDGSEDDLSRVDDLGRELARVERYIDQALYYARSEVVERDYLIRRWSLKALVTGAIKANARELIAAHVAPVCENLDFEVFTDEKWLEFILGQLIQNSIKYACEDGAKIVFSGALLDEGLASERIELTVADNGCGVSAADLPRVFEKGFTGDNGRTTKRATGIGLYLVARLCSKMGIDVTAASDPGEGFVVTFAFSTNKFQYFE